MRELEDETVKKASRGPGSPCVGDACERVIALCGGGSERHQAPAAHRRVSPGRPAGAQRVSGLATSRQVGNYGALTVAAANPRIDGTPDLGKPRWAPEPLP